MKIRLRGNTVRFRLLEPEVMRLAQGESITETLPSVLPFQYSVHPTAVADLAVTFDGVGLRLDVPAEWAKAWHASDEIGRTAKQDTGRGTIEIKVEKDWACTTARPEDNQGTYPNPAGASA